MTLLLGSSSFQSFSQGCVFSRLWANWAEHQRAKSRRGDRRGDSEDLSRFTSRGSPPCRVAVLPSLKEVKQALLSPMWLKKRENKERTLLQVISDCTGVLDSNHENCLLFGPSQIGQSELTLCWNTKSTISDLQMETIKNYLHHFSRKLFQHIMSYSHDSDRWQSSWHHSTLFHFSFFLLLPPVPLLQ